MDGTIFDTEKVYYQTWKDVAKKRNFYFDLDSKKELLGLSYKESIKKMQELFSVNEKTAIEIRKELNKLRDEIFKNNRQSLKKKGFDELFSFLKENNKIVALASSSPRKRIDFLLEKEGMKDYFDFIISGDDIVNGKPSPEIFEKTMLKLGVKPEETYVIEDSYAGIVAANSSKAFSVFIPDLDNRSIISDMSHYTFKNLHDFLDHLIEDELENEEARKIDKNRTMTFLITCNECINDFEVDLNTAFIKNNKINKIMDDDFALLTCPNCGHKFTLNYRFVYTDNERKFMIVNDPNFIEIKNQLAFKSSLRLLDKISKEEIEGFKIRMCKEIEETREKILIFENNLDDKIIELMKIFLADSNDFDFDKNEVKSIIYTKNNKFLIKLESKNILMDFIDEIYNLIKEKYEIYFEDNIAENIDKKWAIKFMKDIIW